MSTGAGGAGPELRCCRTAAMFGPQVPPRIAACDSDNSPSSVGPAVWTSTAPNSRRRHVGI
eukprot:5964248-Alexandrium_andersonii.AAC.1